MSDLSQFHDLPILRELGGDLHAAFEAQEKDRPTPAQEAPRRLGWLLAAGVLATASAVAIMLALTSGLDNGRVSPTAAEALERAARAAGRQPAPVPRTDQFYFVHSQASNIVSPAFVTQADDYPTALVTRDRRIWSSISRRGQLVERTTATRFLTAAQRAKWERAGRPPIEGGPGERGPSPVAPAAHYRLGTIELTRQELLDFPTDPQLIYRRLRARVGDRGHSPAGEVFEEIGDALRESPAPARLRAGLYRALALVPGIEFVGRVHDRLGRAGTAVALAEVGIRHELIFDPETAEMLAEREIVVSPERAGLNVPARSVIGETVYLQRAVTDDLRAP